MYCVRLIRPQDIEEKGPQHLKDLGYVVHGTTDRGNYVVEDANLGDDKSLRLGHVLSEGRIGGKPCRVHDTPQRVQDLLTDEDGVPIHKFAGETVARYCDMCREKLDL